MTGSVSGILFNSAIAEERSRGFPVVLRELAAPFAAGWGTSGGVGVPVGSALGAGGALAAFGGVAPRPGGAAFGGGSLALPDGAEGAPPDTSLPCDVPAISNVPFVTW